MKRTALAASGTEKTTPAELSGSSGTKNVVNFVGTPASVDPTNKLSISWGMLKTR